MNRIVAIFILSSVNGSFVAFGVSKYFWNIKKALIIKKQPERLQVQFPLCQYVHGDQHENPSPFLESLIWITFNFSKPIVASKSSHILSYVFGFSYHSRRQMHGRYQNRRRVFFVMRSFYYCCNLLKR